MKEIIRDIIISKPELIEFLGKQLFIALKENIIEENSAVTPQITKQDCIDYILNLTINRTYDGYLREKSVIEDNLAKEFPQVRFEESDPELDHAGDIDYLGWVGNKAFGIQIKPVTIKSNFGNYSASERMKASFVNFTKQYGGNVFIVYSIEDKIQNSEVIAQIAAEIELLSK